MTLDTRRKRQHGRTLTIRDGQLQQRRQPRPQPRRQSTRAAAVRAATREV